MIRGAGIIRGSKVASALSFFAGFVKRSFGDSKTYTLVSRFSDFVERSFSHSLTLKVHKKASSFVYPQRLWRVFDSLNEGIKQGKIATNIFNPLFIFPFTYFAVLAMSSYRPSNLAIFSIFLGIAFFMVGALVSGKVRFKEIYLEEHAKRIAILLLVVGVFFLLMDLYRAKTIPLLEPAVRRHLSVLYTMLASLLVPGGILGISLIGRKLERKEITIREARTFAISTMLIITFLISLLGYRTQVIVSLLGCTIAMYFWNIVGVTEILLSFSSLFLAISSIGYIRALSQGSSMGFFDVIGRRLGLTLSVYDHLITRFWQFGANRGSVALATFSSFFSFIPGPRLGPRTMVARIIGVEKNISITSTLLGTIVLDFGIPGIMFSMVLLGFVVGLAYNAMKQTKSALATAIYSLLIAYALVGIETGLVDFNVAMFFTVSFLILIASRR
jgi:oligosaccharide repeat unit polymerase